MKITTTTLPKSEVQLDIELSTEEFQPYLIRAAASLSREHPIKGFRPGKASLEVATKQYGAMALYEEAIDPAVRDTFVRAVGQESITTVGNPKIDVTALAPENPVRYTAIVAVLPAVTMPIYDTITVNRRSVQITNADVDKALGDLQRMQPNETLEDREATEHDKVVVDMNLVLDGVPIEGGQTTDHQILLNEEYVLPKVREELVGVRAENEKTFPLEFPADHYQKHLAGKTVDCTVKVKGVYGVTYPEPDDAFAQRLGIDSILALRGRIRENLEAEAQAKAREQEDRDLLEALVTKLKTDELPDVLLTNEAHRMVHELEQEVTSRGLEFDTYLAQLGKSHDDLLIGMAPEAVKRVKIALATRAIGEQHADVCAVTDEEIDEEIKMQLNRYRNDADFAERIQSDEARGYVRGMLRNKKVMDWLRSQVQWKEAAA
ncbi:MAG: trigger factor [Candidatus Uhrbacteria bacterium]